MCAIADYRLIKVALNSDEDACWSSNDFYLASAFGTLVGLSLVRRNAIPVLLSPCFLLAAVDGAGVLDDPEVISTLMPDLHEQLLPYPTSIDCENGPLFNRNHPDFSVVGSLLAVHLDMDVGYWLSFFLPNPLTSFQRARITPDMEDAQLLQFRRRLIMTIILHTTASADDYGRRRIVKQFVRGLDQMLNKDTGVTFLSVSSSHFSIYALLSELQPFVTRSMRSLVEALAISVTPTWQDAQQRTDFRSTAGGRTLTPDEILWVAGLFRWMRRFGLLQHPVLSTLNEIEGVRVKEQEPNFRAVSFFKYVTGEEYFSPREEKRIEVSLHILR